MKFNEQSTSRAEETRTENYEGGEAFEPASSELALTKVVINNLLEDSFYESDDESFASVVEAFDAVAETNPEFVLKLAKYARQEENLRQIPQALLVLAANDERTQQFVRDYATDIMSRTDEPLDVLALHVSRNGKTLPNCLQKSIEDAMHQWNEWQYAKWDQPNKEWQYRDLLNLVHPKPRDDERDDIFGKIALGDLDDYDVESLTQEDTWESAMSSETITVTTSFTEQEIGTRKENGIIYVQLMERPDGLGYEEMVHTVRDNQHGWMMENMEYAGIDNSGDTIDVVVELDLDKADKYRHQLYPDIDGNTMGLFPRIRQARDMLEAGVTADEIYDFDVGNDE